MIVILKSAVLRDSPEYRHILDYLSNQPDIKPRVHHVTGTLQTVTEIYLIGDTASLNKADIESLMRERRRIGPFEEDDFNVFDMKQIR